MLSAHSNAQVVIGSWLSGNNDNGWIDWGSQLSITNPANTAKYGFVAGAVSGYAQSLQISQSGYQQNLAIKLENLPGGMAAFLTNHLLSFTYSVPSAASSGSTAGYSQLYAVAINASGYGFQDQATSQFSATGSTNNNNGWQPNFNFYSGAPARSQVVTLNYSNILSAITATPASGYIEIIFAFNNGGGAPTNFFINNVVLSGGAPVVTNPPASTNVVIGSWQDNDGDGWIDWGNQLSITNPANTATYGFVAGAVSGYAQSLQISQSGYQQNLAIKLENLPGGMAAFLTNHLLSFTYSVPSAASSGSTAGYSQLYAVAINASGYGFQDQAFANLTTSGATNDNQGNQPNFYFYPGAPAHSQVVTLNYSNILSAITATPSTGYIEIVFSFNNGGGAPTNFFINHVVLSGGSTQGVTNPPSPPPTIFVDWNNVHQRIDGFGACSAWKSTWTSAQADMFFSTNSGTGTTITGSTNFAFNGIGLSLLRTRVNTNGTGTYENSIMQMAQTRGARVWSTPWSPPPQFKSNGNVNGGNFLSANNQAYANLLAQYVVNMQNSYGVNIYALSVQNEPDLATSYESCVWTPQQIHDFVPYLRSALNAAGKSSVKIIAAEGMHWETNLYAAALSDPAVATNVNIIACHNYDNSPPSGIPAALPRYANTNAVLWQTEVSKLASAGAFDPSMTDAIYWAGRLHLFMTTANVNAWHYWWLVSNNPDNEGLTDINGNPAKRMYVLGQYSRFVRPNNYRINLANYNPNAVFGSAYKDPVSGNFAIVIANTNSAGTNQSFYLTNFTATTVTPWITSSSLSLAAQSAVAVSGSIFSYVIPAMSVVTFVGTAQTNQISTPIIASVPTASAITYGQTLASSTLIGGTATNAAGAVVGGSFAFANSSIAPNAGVTNVGVIFTPTNTAIYTSASNTVAVPVNKANTSVSVTGTTNFTYNGSGQGPASASVTGSSGALSFNYSGTGYGPGAIAPTNAGSYTVTATVAADANYNSASSSALGFTIGAKSASVTANNAGKTVGLPNPALSAVYSGFVNGEDTNVLATLASLTTTADANSPVGGYPITPSGAAAANYTFNYIPGTLTVVVQPQMTVVNSGASVLEFTFPTLPGQMYQLECKTNLTDAVWTPLGSPIPGTGSSASVSITNHSGSFQGFYILQIAQP